MDALRSRRQRPELGVLHRRGEMKQNDTHHKSVWIGLLSGLCVTLGFFLLAFAVLHIAVRLAEASSLVPIGIACAVASAGPIVGVLVGSRISGHPIPAPITFFVLFYLFLAPCCVWSGIIFGFSSMLSGAFP